MLLRVRRTPIWQSRARRHPERKADAGRVRRGGRASLRLLFGEDVDVDCVSAPKKRRLNSLKHGPPAAATYPAASVRPL